MIAVKAKIFVFESSQGGRKTPFQSGYRPLFSFMNNDIKTSGKITLIDRDKFFPGTEGIVEILFLGQNIAGVTLATGLKFTFGEALTPLGHGEIIQIIN